MLSHLAAQLTPIWCVIHVAVDGTCCQLRCMLLLSVVHSAGSRLRRWSQPLPPVCPSPGQIAAWSQPALHEICGRLTRVSTVAKSQAPFSCDKIDCHRLAWPRSLPGFARLCGGIVFTAGPRILALCVELKVVLQSLWNASQASTDFEAGDSPQK